MSDSIDRFEWERHAYAEKFNGEALRVLWCYASFADATTLITFPTIRQVAEATGISVERVGRFRTELLDTGWLAESNEKTSRGNPKLMLAIGETIDAGYLGEKRKVNAKSVANLIPAAKQKKRAEELEDKEATTMNDSLDFPDEAGLENAEDAGLENADIDSLDFPDVTTSELNNHSLSTSNNHASADAAAPVIRFREKGYPVFSNIEGMKVTYFLNSEGVTKTEKKSVTPKIVGGSRKVDMTFFDVQVRRRSPNKELAEAARTFFEAPNFFYGEGPMKRYLEAFAAAREQLAHTP